MTLAIFITDLTKHRNLDAQFNLTFKLLDLSSKGQQINPDLILFADTKANFHEKRQVIWTFKFSVSGSL